MSWLVPVIFIVLAFARLPLFIVIVGLALWGFYQADLEFSIVTIEIYRITEIPILSALPLFTFVGYLLSESNTSHRLLVFSRALLGWLPASLAMVTIIISSLFTAFTGASGATIVAVGALLYPALKADGYKQDFSLGLVTCSGSLGLLIPPALPLILYGVIAQQMDLGVSFSLQQLLLAGLLPALLMMILLSAWAAYTHRDLVKQRTSFSLKELFNATKSAGWELPLPPLILYGLYSGFLTLTEIAVISCVYFFVVEVFVYREISFAKLAKIVRESMLMSGGILIVLAVSLALANWMIDQSIPQQLFEWMSQYIESKWEFLLLINIVLLLLGAVLDIFSALVIMVPLLLPLAVGYGIHPVHLGIIFLANMQIGYLTPPIGMNLFIASYRFGLPITQIFRSVLPFILILLFALMIITYVPWLSLFML